MKQKRRFNHLSACLLCLLWLGMSACGDKDNSVGNKPPEDRRPNILLIVADDLGYSDIGAFGGEIRTPNLNTLSDSGLTMTNFYANPVCSPTRAALMSGTDSHVSGVGTLFEALHERSPEQAASEAYSGYLLTTVDAFPKKLREAGYHTYMTGKWHLANLAGGLGGTVPGARGFERSFALMNGGSSHFEDGLAALPSPVPVGVPGHSPYALYVEDDIFGQRLPAGFYSTTYYTDKMLEYIDINKGDGKPYFAYVAYTAPHWPLQLPLEAMEEGNPWQQKFAAYEDQYFAAGYDTVWTDRVARMKNLGLVDPTVEPNSWAELNHGAGVPAWDSLTEEERHYKAREMAVYAVMVEYMDYQIGRLLEHVDQDNTIVVFLSDNGAENQDLDMLWQVVNPTPESIAEWEALTREVAGTEDYRSYENLGRPGSYLSYAPGWTRVSAAPFRLHKTTTAEGGIRVPLIAKYPGMTNAGVTSSAFATVMDIAPTFLEVAQAESPRQALRGASMVSYLSGAQDAVHDSDFGVGWEMFDGRAYIQDDYKLFVWTPNAGGDGSTWEMFDLSVDPTETNNLVGDPAYEETYQSLRAGFDQYVEEVGVITRIPAP